METSQLSKSETSSRSKAIRVGDIITFKKPIMFNGSKYSQLAVMSIERKKGHIRLIGFTNMTRWFNSFEELDEVIDWEWMDEWIIH